MLFRYYSSSIFYWDYAEDGWLEVPSSGRHGGTWHLTSFKFCMWGLSIILSRGCANVCWAPGFCAKDITDGGIL
jgi:hypothetical protein